MNCFDNVVYCCLHRNCCSMHNQYQFCIPSVCEFGTRWPSSDGACRNCKMNLHDMRGDVRHTVFICCAHHSANIVKLFRCVQMIRFHWNSPFSGARNHSKSISGVKWMIRKLFVCMVGTQWTLHLMHTTGAINLNPSHTIRKLYLEQYYIQRWSLKIWKCILAKEALKGAKWSLPNC